MEQQKKSRITPAGQAVIKKTAAWGRANKRYRKQVIAALVVILLWCYLLYGIKEFFKRKRNRILAAIPAAGILIWLLTAGVLYLSDDTRYRQGIQKLYRIMEASAEQETGSGETAAEEAQEVQEEEIGYDIAALWAVNPDCVGWLRIEDTGIDEPVMQRAGDENYYLRRDFFGKRNKNGCLILDEDSSVSEGCDNLIIHGHNMKSGEMFGELENYKDPEYASEHALIQFETKEGVREFQVMAAFYSRVFYEDEAVFKYYDFTKILTYDSFLYYYKNIKKMSLYDTGVEANWGDCFLTLSTCSGHEEHGRFVVIAKQIE